MKVTIAFDRLGRHHPTPMECTVSDHAELPREIEKFARRHLGSRDVDVLPDGVELVEPPKVGDDFYVVVGGFRTAGHGTVTAVEA